jgi:hypothetical protein
MIIRSTLRRLGFSVLFAGAISLGQLGVGADPAVTKVIDVLESAVGSIRSCDVVINAVGRRLYHVDEGGVREWGAGERPPPENYHYRQIFWKSKRRIEALDETGSPTLVAVQDWEGRRHYDLTKHEGMIRKPVIGGCAPGTDYSLFYKSVCALVDIYPLFRERLTTGVKGKLDSEGPIGLTCDFEEATRNISLGGYSYEVLADKTHGLMPKTVREFWHLDGKKAPFRETEILEYLRLPDGTWVPVKAKTTTFWAVGDKMFGTPVQEIVATVDVGKSRWNVELDPKTFILPFPVGTKVFDDVRQVHYITGKPDPGDNLKVLAAGARDKVVELAWPKRAMTLAPWFVTGDDLPFASVYTRTVKLFYPAGDGKEVPTVTKWEDKSACVAIKVTGNNPRVLQMGCPPNQSIFGELQLEVKVDGKIAPKDFSDLCKLQVSYCGTEQILQLPIVCHFAAPIQVEPARVLFSGASLAELRGQKKSVTVDCPSAKGQIQFGGCPPWLVCREVSAMGNKKTFEVTISGPVPRGMSSATIQLAAKDQPTLKADLEVFALTTGSN